ncbi:toxin glutamine deamidase domain-containing protein [Micromonospora pallida]|uniref:toxin glutamine deamidase domain-containing protein n=1 Tax=Micromonospora pallida TaxID=145854 RepID=UPI00114CDFD7|nr:toxin glutamine deamidase domain-containing protein [Micromonospora pallida]
MDAAILHLTADALAGLNIADAAVTTLVQDARQTLSAPQRHQWAETIRHLADNATGTRGPALRHLADRLFTTAPDPDPVPDASDASDAEVARVRQVTRERLQQATQELQRTVDDLDQARRDERDAQGAREAAEASLDAARTALTRAEGERARLEENIDHLDRAMPELEAEVTRRERLESAARQTVDDPATSQDESRLAAAQAELDQARRELDVARTALEKATGDLRDAGQDLDRVRAELPDLRRQVETASEEFRARDVSAQAHANTVRMLDEARTAREDARDAAQQQVDAMALPVPAVPRGTPVVNVDTALAEIARSGHGRSVGQELEHTVRARHDGTVPARVVLSTDPTRQADNAATAPADETPVHELDRVQLARDLAASLTVPVELRVDGGTRAEPPYLAYPGGEVVRLDITGRPESLDDAVRRLPQRVQDDLAAHRGRSDVYSRLEILHEAEIESRQDFATAVTALVENLNRHQGYLAHRWVTQAVPPVDTAGLRALADGLDTTAWPEPTSTPPAGPVETGRPDAVAAAWLAYIPQYRADMLADMLDAVPGLGFTVSRPTRELPADQRPGARVLAVAGSTAAAGVVLPTTQLHWYEPARNQIHTGSMRMLGTWANDRAGEEAGPEGIWYIVLTPNGTDRPRDPSALAHHVDVAARTTSTSTPPVEPDPSADVAGAVRGDVSLPGGAAAFEWGAAGGGAVWGGGSSSGWAAGVEPSVERVDGGWRVSYRSSGSLPPWGEMTHVFSDRFTWQGPEPLRLVPTPGEVRPFRVEDAGEEAGERVFVDYWAHRESGAVAFRLRLAPDADVDRASIVGTLRAVEQWVVETNRAVGSGGGPRVEVVFDPVVSPEARAEVRTKVRLSRAGIGLRESHDVWVSADGSAGRIDQLHWLAGLAPGRYGHELKHFVGVPHTGSPRDFLRRTRPVGEDHLHEPGFTGWEIDQILAVAESFVASTVAPRSVGPSGSESPGSNSEASESPADSLPGRAAAMEWHPPADSEADGQPSGPAEGDPFGFDPELALWDDPLEGLDLRTPAAGSGWSLSGGQMPDWEKEVAATIRSLKLAGVAAETAFGKWAREVFDFDRASLDRRPNYVFNESVLNTYRDELGRRGVTTQTGLSGWLARQLAEELALGGSSRFRELLPYPDPENMSEQQRDALHRIWLDKIANARSAGYEVAHVALHVLAQGLDQPMRVHHPFGNPYDDIGPPSDGGAIPQPVVWWKGGYIILKPRDPTDADIVARIASGYRGRSIYDPEQQQRDSLFNEALRLLKAEIAAAEEKFSGRHRSLLRYKLDRDLAAIGKRPFSPRRQAEELDVYRRYLTGLSSGGGTWEGGYRWELEDPFTLRVAAFVRAGRYSGLSIRLGGNQVQLTHLDHMVLPGDMVDIDFGSVDGTGVGIVKMPYLANGAEKFAYRKIDREFTDSELVELRDRTARARVDGQAWQLDEPPVSALYHIVTPLDHRTGQLSRSFGKGSEGEKLRRARIPALKVAADGSPFVIPDNLEEVIVRLGYGLDGQPIAVVVMPAGKSGTGQDLYLQLVNPAPTVDDIEFFRKRALWERGNWWALSRVRSFEDTIDWKRRVPGPLGFTLGGRNSGRTLDGREVNIDPGTPITLEVGERLRPTGKDGKTVEDVVVVVKAPLVPRREGEPESEPEYAFRLFSKDATDYDALIKQLEDRQRMVDRRKKEAEWAAGRGPKRPRIDDGSSLPVGADAGSSETMMAGDVGGVTRELPGQATVPHQQPPPPDMAGVSVRGDVLLPSQLSPAEVSVWFDWLGSVNPGRGEGFDTNCVLTAIGTDMSLAGGVGWQVPPDVPSPVAWLQRYAEGRPLVEVADYDAVVEVMAAAEPGARGVLVMTGEGDRISHTVNVVRTDDGRVVFLDGQRGGLARGPVKPGRLRFVATTDGVGVPRPPAGVADAATVTVAEHADLAGMDEAARPPSGSRVPDDGGRTPSPDELPDTLGAEGEPALQHSSGQISSPESSSSEDLPRRARRSTSSGPRKTGTRSSSACPATTSCGTTANCEMPTRTSRNR